MKEQLSAFLALEGFVKVNTNLDSFFVYLKKETGHVTAIFAYFVSEGEILTKERYVSVKESAMNLLAKQDLPEIHPLFLILTADMDSAKAASGSDSMCWFIKTDTNELIVPDDRVEDFYGMRRNFLNFLANPERAKNILGEMQAQLREEIAAKEKELEKKRKEFIPWVSLIIIGVNALVALLMVFFGDPLMSALDLDPVAIFEKHQWYRVFTYMYVHAGVSHILNNMIMLYMEGNNLEAGLGRVRYVLLYHIFGMIAGLGSLLYKVYSNSEIPSVGASGAIMGLLGLLLFISLRNLRRMKRGIVERLLILALCAGYSIYQGFLTPGVDNAAHIAGMLAGVFTGIVWDILIRQKRKGK